MSEQRELEMLAARDRLRDQRRAEQSAGWRAFNRLSAAVSRHLARSQPDHPAYSFPDDCDDDLHRAYTKILRDIGPPVSRETVPEVGAAWDHNDTRRLLDEEDLTLRGGSP